MAQTQTSTKNNRSEGAKKAAATRAAKKLEQQQGAEHNIPEEQRQGERRQQQDNAIAQFAASQMTTPAAHEPTDEQAKQAAFLEAVKAMASSMGVDASAILAPAAPAKATRTARLQQNGITRPTGGVTGQIWDLADKLSADNQGQPVAIATLRAHADLKQVNENTLKTQYARWRGYHGIKGRAAPVQAANDGTPMRRATDQPSA